MPKPTKEDLAKMHWKDRYEFESAQESQRMDKLSEQALIAKIEQDNLDQYFGVWRAIGRKGSLANAAMPMWRYLQRNPGKQKMLHRYHCAAALFQILGMSDPASENELRKQVQWDSHGEEARQQALLELKEIIEEMQDRDASFTTN